MKIMEKLQNKNYPSIAESNVMTDAELKDTLGGACNQQCKPGCGDSCKPGVKTGATEAVERQIAYI